MMDITTIPGWQTKSPEELHAYASQIVETPTGAEVTMAMIRDHAGLTQEEYGLVRGTLDTAIATLRASDDPATRMRGLDLDDALQAMRSRGIDLGASDRQQVVDELALFGDWPNEVRDKIKALGVRRETWWHRETGSDVPDAEELVDSQHQMLRKEAVKAVRSRCNSAVAAADSAKSQGQSPEQIAAAAEAAFLGAV